MSSHKKQISWSLMDQALVSGTNFLLGIILVRFLGIEQYGIFVLIWMIVQFFSSIQNALIISPMLTIAPQKNEDIRKEYLANTFYMQILFTCILLVLVFLLALIPEYIRPVWLNNEALVPLVTVLILFQIQDYIRRNLFVNQMSKQVFYIDLIAYGLQVPIVFMVLYEDPSFEKALMIISGCMFFSMLCALCWVRVYSLSSIGALRTIKHHWVSSKWLLGAAITQWLSGNYFLIVSGTLIGPAVVGAIKAAQNLLGLTHIVFQALENVVPSEASRCLHLNGVRSLTTYLMKVGFVLTVATSVVAIVVFVFAEPILSFIYGEANQYSIQAMIWFVPIYILISLGLPLRSGLRCIEKTKSIFIASLLGAIFSLVTASYFINEYAINGLMFGMLMVQLMTMLILARSLFVELRYK